MKFLKWTDKHIANLHWYHMSLIKLSAAAFALLIAKLWPPLLSLDWYWYLVLVVVFAYVPTVKFFCKVRAKKR